MPAIPPGAFIDAESRPAPGIDGVSACFGSVLRRVGLFGPTVSALAMIAGFVLLLKWVVHTALPGITADGRVVARIELLRNPIDQVELTIDGTIDGT